MRRVAGIAASLLLTATLGVAETGCWNWDFDPCWLTDSCGNLCDYLVSECGAYEDESECTSDCLVFGLPENCIGSLCDMSCSKLTSSSVLESKACLSECETTAPSCESHAIHVCAAGRSVGLLCDCVCQAQGLRYAAVCGDSAALVSAAGTDPPTSDHDVCWCTFDPEQGDRLARLLETIRACTGEHYLKEVAESYTPVQCAWSGNPQFLGYEIDLESVTGLVDLELPELPLPPQSPLGCVHSGPCAPGQSAGFKWILIDDHADNPTLTDCNNNPGADIDAVCVYRDDEEIGCAIEAQVYAGDPICDENTKDDINETLDIPDAYTPWDAPEEPYTGYYSLNGRSIVLSFDAGIEFLCGDEVGVFEVQNPDNPDTLEKMIISYGVGDDCFDGTDCLWSLESDWAVGEDYIDVSWEW